MYKRQPRKQTKNKKKQKNAKEHKPTRTTSKRKKHNTQNRTNTNTPTPLGHILRKFFFLFKPENERFRTAKKSMTNLHRPETRFFLPDDFFGCRFSRQPPPGKKKGSIFDPFFGYICSRKRRLDLDSDRFTQVVGGNTRRKKPKVAVQATSICRTSETGALLLAAPRYPSASRLGHYHEPVGSGCDGVAYESLATVLPVVTAACSKRYHNMSRRSRGQSVSGR